ncbi:hypothetical protein MMC19_003535 [Ptychographa xylographoides]|nr:hypothetical protein [Ptychographa xylographoides]
MAPSDDRDPVRPQNDEDNPFITFRRFADEQMASLLQSFLGVPSSSIRHDRIERPSSNHENQSVNEGRSQKQDCWDPLGRQVQDAYRNHEEDLREAVKEVRAVEEEKRLRRDAVPVTTCAEAVKDDHESDEIPRCPYWPADRPVHASFARDELRSPGSWAYMIYSPYSPLNLEKQEFFRDHGSRWRNAFEELLSFESGNRITEETERQRQREVLLASRASRIQSLLHRYKQQNPKLDGSTQALATRQAENDVDEDDDDENGDYDDVEEEESTELDFYERSLERQRTEGPSVSIADQAFNKALAPSSESPHTGTATSQESGLGIISTLTSTQRVALPDGTVYTKVVLKKRFADGREESSETVHTTQGGQREDGLPDGKQQKQIGDTQPRSEMKEKESGEKKGWFWS